MQRYGQLSAKPPAKPPPEQNCYFIKMMLLGNSQVLSGGMPCQQGLLRRGEEFLPMSQESIRSLWEKYAEPTANLTPGQVQKLKNFRFRAFLWTRLLRNQRCQSSQMRVASDVLRHLMTKCIPRIRISPIRMPESPVKQAWELRGSVVYDPSGFMYNGIYHDWSPYHHHIKAITSHSKHPWIALMHSDGNVWIGKIGDRDNLFWLIHSPKKDEEKAKAFAFHPFKPLIAVAIQAQINVYNFSDLKPKLQFAVSFYESGYFCPRPKYSADHLDWNPDGTFLTAISEEKLSMCYFIDPDTQQVIGGFHGCAKYAELRSGIEIFSPNCSCFSVNGKQVVTGYTDGTLMARSAVHTAEQRLTLSCLKISDKVLPGQIVSIVAHPHNPSVFAIEVKAKWSRTSVLIVLVDHDGSFTITATIPDAKSPHFHEDWLLVSSRNRILFHHMNCCNIPCLVTEFFISQEIYRLFVEIDAFCVKSDPNGKTILYYSYDGKSSLCTAEIALS